MFKKKTCNLAAVLCTAVLLTACNELKNDFNPDAKSILTATVNAVAKESVREGIQSSIIYYQLVSPVGEANLSYTFKIPGMLRVDLWDDDEAYVYCTGGKSSWSFADGTVHDMTEYEASEFSDYIKMLPFRIAPQEFFTDCKLLPEQEIAAGQECYVVTGKTDDGEDARIYIAKDTKLPAQLEVKTDEGDYVTQYFEYEEHDGVNFAKNIFIFDPVEGAYRLDLQYVEFNTLTDDSEFERPEPISLTEE